MGAIAANTHAGLKDDTIEKLGHGLLPGNSALVIVSSREYLGAMQEYAAGERATAAVKKLTANISEHVVRGQNAAYLVNAAIRSVSCHQLGAEDGIAKLLGI